VQLQGYESSDVLGRLQQEFPLATWKCQQDPDNSSEWEIELSATTGVVIWQSKRLYRDEYELSLARIGEELVSFSTLDQIVTQIKNWAGIYWLIHKAVYGVSETSLPTNVTTEE